MSASVPASVPASVSAFWSPSFWLIGDVTWQNLTSTPELRLPSGGDIALVPWIAILLVILRKLVEKTFGEPLGLALGIPPKKTKIKKNFEENPILEQLFYSSNRTNADIAALSAKTDMSQRQIESWLRRRQRFANFAAKPQVIDKFKESTWRLVFYLAIFLYGCITLWDKPWTWSSRHLWTGWPKHPLDDSIRWYYLIEAAFYSSLMFSQFTDVKRKDFWQMFIHHIVTLCLMFASWFTNTVRVGSLVLVVHDAVDWILESTKMAAYARYDNVSTVMVSLFGIVWLVTRLIYFPLHIIRTCYWDSLIVFEEEGIGSDVGGIFYLLVGCLSLLVVLHAVWFYKIVLLAVRVVRGDAVKDNRSESEDEGDEELEEEG